MAARTGAVHVATTRRKYKGKTYETTLLRRSYREGAKVKNETLGNLSHLPAALIDVIRRSLKGERFVAAQEQFEIVASRAHGHVQAVATAMQRLGMSQLLGTRACRERDVALAMIAARIVAPQSKLATSRSWHLSTLAEDFEVADASEDELYAAMDWLLERQARIEKKLAARHAQAGSVMLYDLSSSYFEGTTCPLAKRGYNRDGKKGKLQVNYGLLADRRGCPVAVSVYEGNVSDSTTFMPQVERLRRDFDVEEFVIVGDRGMMSKKIINELRDTRGVEWITALRSTSIRSLLGEGHLQLDLFDERNLFEFSHPHYPDERLVACRNQALASRRQHKRESLLLATEKQLEKVHHSVRAGRLRGQDRIGVRVGKVIDKYKVAKHFTLDITDDDFAFERDAGRIAAEAALDGLYVIRTSLPAERMDGAQCVRHYKALADVERVFLTMKSLDLRVRPIHHRLAERVRAHIFMCMLAYYVEWHMREAWRALTFSDESLRIDKWERDPVAPATRSANAQRKVARKTLDDGSVVHSYRTLMADLATIVRNTCRSSAAVGPDSPTFNLTTTPTDTQRRALNSISAISA